MFPDEKRSGTYELLLTSPVRIGEIVLGKFFGGLALVLLMLMLSGFFGYLLAVYGNPELPMMLSGYLGLTLMAVAFLAIGTLVSSFTENVVIAYVGALFALLVLYTVGWLGESVTFVSHTGDLCFGMLLGSLEGVLEGRTDLDDAVDMLARSFEAVLPKVRALATEAAE